MTDYSDSLTGAYVRVWPYAMGVYPKDFMYKVWCKLSDENGLRRIFYGNENQASRDSLETFCGYFLGKILFVVEYEKDIGGIVWFENAMHDMASINLWMAKAALGKPAREGLTICLDHVKSVFRWHTIWGETPWPEACKIGMDVGFKLVAKLPGRIYFNGKYRTSYILKKEL